MSTFTIADIRSWKPWFDPSHYLPIGWSGTAQDVLAMTIIPPEDRLWIVLRPRVTCQRIRRLFAVRCCDPIKHLLADPRSLAALDVAERYARGEATAGELALAHEAAVAVSSEITWSAYSVTTTDATQAASHAATAVMYATKFSDALAPSEAYHAAYRAARAIAHAAVHADDYDPAYITASDRARHQQINILVDLLTQPQGDPR